MLGSKHLLNSQSKYALGRKLTRGKFDTKYRHAPQILRRHAPQVEGSTPARTLERTVFKPRDVADDYFQKRAACKIFGGKNVKLCKMASPRHGISELRSSSGLKTVSFRLQQSPWNSTLLAIPFRCVTPKHRTALRKTGTLPGEGVRSLKGFARQIIYSELKICRLNACLNAL